MESSVASVLLIETQAPLMRLMAWFLLEAGFEVTKAEGVDDGLLKVAERHPAVIIFNTGIDCARKSDAIHQLRGASPQSRILDVSDISDASHRPKPLLNTGADAYLSLPLDADDLVDCVKG